jgi:aminopeptidase N
MQDLRTLIGDEAFYSFLKDYASHEAGEIATADDFFNILREHTSVNLDGLLAKYFKGG